MTTNKNENSKECKCHYCTSTDQCNICKGTGLIKTNMKLCNTCNGIKCIFCNSSGYEKQPYEPCDTCDSSGRIPKVLK